MATEQDLIYNVRVNDTQLDRLIARTAELNSTLFTSQAALKPLDAQLRGLGRRFTEVGRFMTRSFTVPLLAAGAASAKMAFDFDKSMSRIQTLGGATAAEMAGLKKSVLDLADSTLTAGPQQLADALYFIRSSGFGAAEGLKVLKASNTGAMIGMGDTKTVADAVTSAMNAYGHSTYSASKVVDIFAKTVEKGKAEPADLAAAIGRVIPIAHQMGVGLGEVGGEIASMTLQGLSAQSAVTGLRAILTTFTRGLPITQKGLATIGLSIGEVQKAIRTQGLAPTLNLIRQRVNEFDKTGGKLFPNLIAELRRFGPEGEKAMLKLQKASGNTAASLLSELFPNVRALNSFLITTGKNAKGTAQNIGEITNSTGYAAEKFKEIQQQPWAQFTLAWSRLRVEIIKVGEAALPIFTKLMKVALAFFHILDGLGPVGGVLKSMIGQVAIFLIVIGPLLRLWGTLIRLSSVYVLRRGKDSAASVGYAAEEDAAIGSIGTTATATSAQIASMGAAMNGSSAQIVASCDAARAAITGIGAEALVTDTQIASMGEAMVGQQALFDESVGEMTGQMTLLDAEVNRVKADLLEMGIVAKEAQTGGFMFMGPGGKFLKGSQVREGQAAMGGIGEQMPLFDPRLFKGEMAPNVFANVGSEAEVAAGKVGLMTRAAGVLKGSLGSLRGAAIGATAAMAGFLEIAWPFLAIEGAFQLYTHWNQVGDSIYNATVNLQQFLKQKVPGGSFLSGAVKGVGSFISKGIDKSIFPDWVKKATKYLLVGLPGELFKTGHADALKNAMDKTKDSTGKTKDYATQLAKILGISVAEAKRLLGLTQDTSKAYQQAAQDARSLFEAAFSRLQGDIQTAFDARTNHMTDLFDRKTNAMLAAFDQRTSDTWAAMDQKFTRHTDAMLLAFDRQSSDTWDAMAQKFEDKTDQMVAKMRVVVKVGKEQFTIGQNQLTPAERELKALEKSDALRQNRRDLLTAGQAAGQAIDLGDPYAYAQAQAKIEDARDAIQKDALQSRADVERKAADAALTKGETALRRRRAQEEKKDQRQFDDFRAAERQKMEDYRTKLETDEQRAYEKRRDKLRQRFEDERTKLRDELVAERNLEWRHLEDRLTSLEQQLEKRRITISVFNTKLRGLMTQYGVTASDGAQLIGTAFGTQMQESLKNLSTVIARHAKYLGNKHKELAAQAEHAATRVTAAWKRMADGIIKQVNRAVAAIKTMTDAQTGAYTGPAGGPNYGAGVGGAHGPGGPLGGSSTAYFGDVLGLLMKGTKKKLTAAQYMKTIAFFNMWAHQESVPQDVDPFNALGTSLKVGGSHPTNKYKVQAYKTWRDGVVATVRMLSQSNFKNLLLAVMSGDPLNYIATHKAAQDELQRWSGTWHGGYHNIKSGLSSDPLPIGNVKAAIAAAKAAAKAPGGPLGTGGGGGYGKRILSSAFSHYEQGGGFQVAATAYSASHAGGHSSTSFHLPGERQPYDCSAFVQAVFKNSDMKDPGSTTYQQIANGHRIAMNSLLPGDLVFFNYGGERWPGHVAIYMGNGMCIHDRGANGGGVEQVSLSALSSGSNHKPEARCYISQHVHYSQGFGGGGGPTTAPAARSLASAASSAASSVGAGVARAGSKIKGALFTAEGPGLYAAAFAHNRKFAKKGSYQTKLTPKQEKAFRAWVKSEGVPFDVNAAEVDYDMRGFWLKDPKLAAAWRPGQHFPDTFKTPYDTTFSNQSMYATANNPFVWKGNTLIDRRTGNVIYGTRPRAIAGVPSWLQGQAHSTVKMIASKIVEQQQQDWNIAHRKAHYTVAQRFAATIPELSKTLTAAEKKRLGPAGTEAYLTKMAMIASNPLQTGLVTTVPGHALDLPWMLGPAGVSGTPQNININIYESGNPRKTATVVRDVLQKHSARNAKSVRGRHAGEKVGLK